MSILHQLAGQTAIYGLSSIVGRLLNFLLVPLYTGIFAPEAYGTFSELMAVVAFVMVVLTYGFETAFFRYVNKEEDVDRVMGTGFISLVCTSLLFLCVASYFSESIADLLHVSSQPKFIQWLIYIIVFDVLSTLPFAKLRVEQRAWRFASIRLINIAVNIGFNLFFFLLCPYLIKEGIAVDIIASIYEPSLGIGYIFISNLIASAVMLVLLSPEILKTRLSFHFELWKKMSRFGFHY